MAGAGRVSAVFLPHPHMSPSIGRRKGEVVKARITMATARKRLLRRGRALLRSGASRAAGADVLAGLEDGERRELTEVHRALERIERGIYGRCEGCFEAVGDDRLEAVPHEPLCASCAMDAESIGAADAHAA